VRINRNQCRTRESPLNLSWSFQILKRSGIHTPNAPRRHTGYRSKLKSQLGFPNRVLRTRFRPQRSGRFAPLSFTALGGKIQATRYAGGRWRQIISSRRLTIREKFYTWSDSGLQPKLLISYYIKIVWYKLAAATALTGCWAGRDFGGSDDRLIRIHFLTKNLKFIEIFQSISCRFLGNCR
jgi:hypothetical protein